MTTWKVEKPWFEELKKRIEHEENNYQKMVEIRSKSVDNEKELRSLDSTLKKTTSFMKKVKILSAATIPALIEELTKLNLSKFVEEMAAGIIETKLKLSDIPKVADFCVAISGRYQNFSEQIAGEFKKVLPLKKTDKVTNMAKLRTDIIFLSELILCGVFNEKDGLQVLGGVLSYLVHTDKTDFINVGLITTVCRYVGWQIASIVSIPTSEDVELITISEDRLPTSQALNESQKKSLRDLLMSYYDSLYKKTEKACALRNEKLKKVKRQERVRGDAGEVEKQELSLAQENFDACRKLAIELSCALGVQIKTLKEEASDDEEDEAANLEMGRALAEGEIVLWSDEETKLFYENLIDLREMVPKSLYKESEERTLENTTMVRNIDDIDVENVNELGDTDAANSAAGRRSVELEREDEMFSTHPAILEDRGVNKWKTFLLDLDHLVSKYSTDKAAVFFVSNLNNKSCRKKFVKLMTNPPTSRMDLMPFYARLVATLENVMPDVTTEIVTQLLETFRNYMQKDSNEKIEVRLACVVMIAELMKFGLVSRAEGLSCLRQLVYDLRGKAVDMTSTMLETGGLYLYRHTDSHAKMKRLLEVIKAKKERMKDSRQIMLIENAYFTCIPPEESVEERARLNLDSEDTIMKKFIRHIIVDINYENVPVFLKSFRRLDWNDEEIVDYAIQYLSSPWLLPMENLEHLASAIAGLCALPYLSWIGSRVADSTVETIRMALEVPGMFNQWAHSAIIYLGELYSFELCDEKLIMQVLYQLISFPENEILGGKDLFRVRMVCTLLKSTGEFFLKGPNRTMMKYFLTYFFRYYYEKKEIWNEESEKLESTEDGEFSFQTPFPFEIEIAYAEAIKQFQKFQNHNEFPKDLESALKAVETLEGVLKKQLELAENDGSENGEGSNPSRRGSDDLGMIPEEEEDYDDDYDDEDGDSEYDGGRDTNRGSVLRDSETTKEEDDEFQRQLDRLMSESFRNPVGATQSGPVYDMVIPAAAKNRLERNIRFADDTKEGTSDRSTSPKDSKILSPRTDEEQVEEPIKPNSKVTLMMRGKGNKPVLKTVRIEDDGLRERWEQEKEREVKEREDMKRLTLGQHRRIEMEEEKAMYAQLNNLRFNKNSKKK